MSDPVELKNGSDAFTNEYKPNATVYNSSRLVVRATGSGREHHSFIYFGLPFPKGVTLLSATLRFYTGTAADYPVTGTITAQAVAAKYSMARVNWSNEPGVTGSTASVTVAPTSDNQMYEIDVTSLIQAVSDGQAWYGFRLVSNTDEYKWIHSSDSTDDYRPILIVQWSDAPDIPSDLAPDGNRQVGVQYPVFRCDFTDTQGDTSMQAMQVQVSTTTDFTTPELDTGSYATSVPELDSSLFSGVPWSWGGIAAGATRYWRVQVQDGAGLWSGWSSAAQFGRTDHGVLTITNPAVAPNNYVEEPTPPISWTHTGTTQRAYEVTIWDANDLGAGYLWSTGKITDTATSVTPPAGIINDESKTYRLVIRVWDTVDREQTPGDPIPLEATRDFTYHYSTGISPVTNFSVTVDPVYPWATLDFQRTTAPDSFAVMRDGEFISVDIVPADIFVTGTQYQYIDRTADPRVQHTWKVLAVVGGQTSDNGPTATGTVKAITTMIANADGTKVAFFFNADVSAEERSDAAPQYVLGDSAPVILSQSVGGYEGSVSGVVVGDLVSGLTVDAQITFFEYMRKHIGESFYLTWVDKTIEVVVTKAAPSPRVMGGGSILEYDTELQFYETGY